ncbi:MAG TPA: M23 family metallopeptidase [Aquihabitans sp.]|nr:M23 family metallopeptidase [Aquihabitans sp.]
MATSALWAPVTGGAAPARPAAPAQQSPDAEQGGGGGTSLKAEYDEIIGQEAALIARIDRARAEQVRLREALAKLEDDVKAKRLDLLVAQGELQEAEATTVREAAARKAAEQQVVDAEERLRRQIVASYVAGGEDTSMLDAILKSSNGEDAGNALAYSRAIVGDSDTLVRQLEAARAERRRADRAAKRARRKAEARRDDVASAADFLAAARDRQVGLVADVDAQVEAENAALGEVQGRKALVEGQIASMNTTSDGINMVLADIQRGQPNWKPGDLLITNPMPGYRIGSKFGQRRHPILGTTRLHAGGDIGAPSGTPIYAPADGIVILAGDRGGYGNTTVIDHGFSVGTLYGHQSRIDVRPGQFVRRGELIGLVGSTGLSTGPHLHFETRLKGVPTDPEGIVDFTLPVTSYADEAAAAFGQPGD